MKPATSTEVSRPGAATDTWITKKEAAKLLAVSRNGGKPQPLSERRILEYTQTGALRSAKQRDPKSGQTMVVVSLKDAMRLKHEREHPPVLPAVPNEPKQKLLAAPPVAVVPSCAWLTLAEAEIYSGLPETFLLVLIAGHVLPALNVGVRAGGRWRVKRTDLDRIEGQKSGETQGPHRTGTPEGAGKSAGKSGL